jgi:phenolic acid decarboxylase
MTDIANPIPPHDLSGIVGHRFIYTYANGWQYEIYVKNATTIDYRIHSGHVGGRWVKGQQVDLEQMQAYRDEGPTYPIYQVPEFAYITLFKYVGPNDETIIDTAPQELPPGWSNRTN